MIRLRDVACGPARQAVDVAIEPQQHSGKDRTMQATTTLATWNRRKLVLVAAGLGLLLTLMALILILQTTGSEGQAGAQPATSNNARAAADARFRALNELPVAPAAKPMSPNHRFSDMNQLPEARKAAGMVAGQSRIGFLELNGAESVVLRATGTSNPMFDDERSAPQTRRLAPAIPATEDPPLPEGWIDPYFQKDN